ncbi:hypothetical protein OHB14_36460 [Streptomyces sp. NBC_01613]|uniref:hypothetical protein n=1 Tax=Streptomyces sp. NBC_01613 TaxID=2975896 RepID=UPI00386758C3
MKFPLVTRRLHEKKLLTQKRAYAVQIEQIAGENRGALAQIAGELSRAKDVIALHIAAAGHPSTTLHDPKTFARALREACEAHHVDIRIELARLEGADL